MPLRGVAARTACWGVLASVAVGGAWGQALRTRGAMVTPELRVVYESPEYEGYYQAAEKRYEDAKPQQAITTVRWDGHKPLVWLIGSQRQIMTYTHEFQALKHTLDVAAEDPKVCADPQRVAQISQIEDRLTKENLETLNGLIGSVDLGTLFLSNHKPSTAKVWSKRRVPESLHRLDQSKMGEVVAALDDVNTALSRSAELHVQYAKTASFSANVPMDENDKPLTRQQAEVFWQAYTHPPLDKAIASLFEALDRAQAAMKAEGLSAERAAAAPELGVK